MQGVKENQANCKRLMILSMTGFGRGSATASGRVVITEVKALNSKQMDLVVKLPNRYRRLEGWLRHMVAVAGVRGKIEVTVSLELTGEELPAAINIDLIRQYMREIMEMDRMLGIEHPTDWHSVLLRMPDALKGEDAELSEEEAGAFERAATEALAKMMEFRREEGSKLEAFFRSKIQNIGTLLSEVEPHEESRVVKIRQRLQDQLEKLTGVEYDNGRLEQELIYYIEKLDISEEKQRLRSHLDYFIKTMDDPDGDISRGKKLGFIAQEMGREINTLGSKSNNAEMQIIVVKMKDELEQIKEQVLNVL